jgi:hypothetical protein
MKFKDRTGEVEPLTSHYLIGHRHPQTLRKAVGSGQVISCDIDLQGSSRFKVKDCMKCVLIDFWDDFLASRLLRQKSLAISSEPCPVNPVRVLAIFALDNLDSMCPTLDIASGGSLLQDVVRFIQMRTYLQARLTCIKSTRTTCSSDLVTSSLGSPTL